MKEVIGYIGLIVTIIYGYVGLRKIELIEKGIDKILQLARKLLKKEIKHVYSIEHIESIRMVES